MKAIPMRASRILSVLAAFVVLHLSAVHAQRHPNVEHGFAPEKAFATHDLDHVNLFNGNLVVTIPIGNTYTTNAGLAYQLRLTYNSTVWDFDSATVGGGTPQQQTYVEARPSRFANAGLGWRLSLGALYDPREPENKSDPDRWLYVGADGGQHSFYATLHLHESDAGAEASYDYTRDNSYLRLVHVGGRDGNVKDVEFGDGSVQRFTRAHNSTNPPPPFELTSIRDRFGNTIGVQKICDGTPGCNWYDLKFDDGKRVNTIVFRRANGGNYVVNHVVLARPHGGQDQWRFTYNNGASQSIIARSCKDQVITGDPNYSDPTGASAVVDLLTAVTLPDGSAYSMGGAGDYNTACGPAGMEDLPGTLASLRLPTLGYRRWTYQNYSFPHSAATVPPNITGEEVVGIQTRSILDASGGCSDVGGCTWTYNWKRVSTTPYWIRKTTVMDPLGNDTVHYFSDPPNRQVANWSGWEYGLPFRPDLTTPGGYQYLSRQEFRGSSTASGANPVRSHYVRYERDQLSAQQVNYAQEWYDANRRIAGERTEYHDDGTHAAAVYADFDGVGHYRYTSFTGSFGSGDSRVERTQYNPDRQTYAVDLGTNGLTATYNPFPVGQNWVLGTYSYKNATEAGVNARSQYCFDTASGFLQRVRTVKSGTTPTAQDVLVVYEPDANGNIRREKYYGGDIAAQALGTEADVCTATLPPSSAYELLHTYQHGVRATSEYANASGVSLGFKVLNQSIDQTSGLPAVTWDVTGLHATSYTYDWAGRVTQVALPEGGSISYTYTPAGGPGNLASVAIVERTSGSVVADRKWLVFDAHGRVWREQNEMPNGSTSTKETLYYASGSVSSRSELGSLTNRTIYGGYDPFGRPGNITSPDGSVVQIAYSGVREVRRTSTVAGVGGNLSATTTEQYDRQGRLRRVVEPIGTEATYSYDVGHRMTQVAMQGPDAVGATAQQTRTFVYDNRGFLNSETHPEKGGGAGYGTVTYGAYDARGHARSRTDGPTTLTFTYDRAERLTNVDRGTTPIKRFVYGSTGSARGKLTTADRWNYVIFRGSPVTQQVSETYTHLGLGGRLSEKVTSLLGGGGERFVQTYGYDGLGRLRTVGYPECDFAGCESYQPAAPTFADVPNSHASHDTIEAVFAFGVNSGCSFDSVNRWYCPANIVTRAEAAVFIAAAEAASRGVVGYQPPACPANPFFPDVPCTHWAARWIYDLANRGIVTGCGGGNFCPEQSLTRNPLARWLVAGSSPAGYVPPAATGAVFTDVTTATPNTSSWVEEATKRGHLGGCTATTFCPTTTVTRAAIADAVVDTFDLATSGNAAWPRTVTYSYTNGELTDVSGAASIAYHANAAIFQLSHTNGVTSVRDRDPWFLPRPRSMYSTNAIGSWSSGTYLYDPSGNVQAIGSDQYRYDRANRLTQATVSGVTQTYGLDGFGNMQSVSGYNGRTSSTSSWTNLLTGAVGYDTAGNLTSWNGTSYEYDAVNQMVNMRTSGGTEEWLYAYNAHDERVIAVRETGTPVTVWTLRGADGAVLREYTAYDWGRWYVNRDYFYAGPVTLGSEGRGAEGRRHFTLDHLGTPRLITNRYRQVTGLHTYLPYGEEITALQEGEQMKFTGHERDFNQPSGSGDDLDYMHARFYNPLTARFTSTDPANSAEPTRPQSWNRYAYASGNPINRVDPDGQVDQNFTQLMFPDDHDAQIAFDLQVAKGTAAIAATSVLGYAGGVALGAWRSILIAGQSVMLNPQVQQVGNEVAAALAEQGSPSGMLAAQQGARLFNQALDQVVAAGGTGARMADNFASLASGITSATKGAWQVEARAVARDGATVFTGKGGYIVVFTASGKVFKGRSKALVPVTGSTAFDVDYSALREVN